MINFKTINPDINQIFSGVTNDSRLVQPGFLFLAYPGMQTDGRKYIKQAIENGAAAIAYDPIDFKLDQLHIPSYEITELASKINDFAEIAYPIAKINLELIGVTGTNGKTSIAYMIAESQQLLQKQSRYVGTLGQGAISDIKPLTNTTPDALFLRHLLQDYVKNHVQSVAIEVSSHALSLGRVNNLPFRQAIYTNLSRDHLDFHKTMDAYAAAKASLFAFPTLDTAIINIDDAYANLMINQVSKKCKIYTYGFSQQADFQIISTKLFAASSQFTLKTPYGVIDFATKLLGLFNIYNIVAVIISLISSGFEIDLIKNVIAQLKAPLGRLDVVQHNPAIIIDFAHTPAALENVITTLDRLKQGRLIVVFGCGGDRDRGKRPQMGEIATKYADWTIITSDNPRHENPHAIMQEIESGVQNSNYELIENRIDAIKQAVHLASSEDIILIAGKGHEPYQQIGDIKHPYSDYTTIHQIGVRS